MSTGPKPPPPPMKKAPPPPPKAAAAPPPPPPAVDEDDVAQENPFAAVEPADVPSIPPVPETSSSGGGGIELPSIPPASPALTDEYDGEADPLDPDAFAAPAIPMAPAVPRMGPTAAQLGVYLDVDDDIKKMRRGMSHSTRIFMGVFAIAIVGLAAYGYYQHRLTENRMVRLEEIGTMENRAEMIAALRTEYRETTFRDVKSRILKNLGAFHDVESLPIMIEALETPGVVRRDAAWAIEQIGLPGAASARDPLMAVLPRTTAADETQVVWTLAVLRESRAADRILEMFASGRLQALQSFDPKVIVDVLGADRLKTERFTNHASPAVRIMTARSLAEAASPEVVAPLTSMLTNELARTGNARIEEVIRAAAGGLGRSGSRDAARPLFDLLQRERSMRSSVLESLSKAAAAPQLVVLLGEAREPEVRRDMARLIADTHDPRGADALAGLLADPDLQTRAVAALGLGELADPRAFPVLVELAKIQDNDGIRRPALRALRFVSTPETSTALLALAREITVGKADVLRALGHSGDPRVVATLTTALRGEDSQSAALALGDLHDDATFITLLRMAARPGPTDMGATTAADRSLENETLLGDRRAAIIALGRFGRAQASDTLIRIIDDERDDYELRSLAGQSLGQVANVETIRSVAEKVRGVAITPQVRTYYSQALWQQARPELNEMLFEIIEAENPEEIKRAAGLALGFAANPANDARLITLLAHEKTRRAASYAIALGGGERAIEALRTSLASDADLKDVFRTMVSAPESQYFRTLTRSMVESGAVYRRMRAAWQLKQGEGDNAHGYVWDVLLDVYKIGSEGPGGATIQFLREQLWQAINSQDEAVRDMAARMLLATGEHGILLRARDAGGVAEVTARAALREEARAAAASGR